MIKRTATIFFILFANIMLLAHVVVPHHHHKYEIYLVNSHHRLDREVNKHSDTNHDNDCKDDYENCVLKQVVVLPSNSIKHALKWLDCSNNNDFQVPQVALFNVQSEAYISVPASKTYPPPIVVSTYSNFVNSVKGLRAPPVV